MRAKSLLFVAALAILISSIFTVGATVQAQAQSGCDLTTVAAYNNRGDDSYYAGDYAGAVADYTCALALDADNVNTLTMRGNAYVVLERYAEAIADYDAALAAAGDQDYLYYNRGTAYLALNDYVRAESDLNKALEISPDHGPAYNNRANIYYDQGDYVRAIQDYDKSIEMRNGDLYIPYYNRGIAHYELGKYAESIADLTQSATINPQYSFAFLARAGTYQVVDVAKSHADFLKWIELIEVETIAPATATTLTDESLDMSEGRVYRYNFQGSAGQIFNAVARANTSDELDPLLVLLDGDNKPVASDDDSGVNLDAVIAGFTLPDDGLYTLVVSHAGFGSEGEILLTMTLDGEASKVFEVYSLAVNQPARVYTTEGDRLNLRSGPGLNFAIVGKLDKETTVILLEGPRKANGLAWWRVRTADGLEGWSVERVDTEQTLQPPLVMGGEATVFPLSGDKLNVRAGAGRANNIVTQLEPGVIVTLIDGPQVADGFRWWKIRLPDGVEGWAVDEAEGEQTLIGKAAPVDLRG